ncbi:hypothetical protein BJ742DRAFT_743301 [Cladochytrium replicatum]|nr:hypothetical protein BJ742DRAFT_743301 [Cladochytrium replicatum]
MASVTPWSSEFSLSFGLEYIETRVTPKTRSVKPLCILRCTQDHRLQQPDRVDPSLFGHDQSAVVALYPHRILVDLQLCRPRDLARRVDGHHHRRVDPRVNLQKGSGGGGAAHPYAAIESVPHAAQMMYEPQETQQQAQRDAGTMYGGGWWRDSTRQCMGMDTSRPSRNGL